MKAYITYSNAWKCDNEREVEINTLQDLLDLKEKEGNSLIICDNWRKLPNIDFFIEVYNGYRE